MAPEIHPPAHLWVPDHASTDGDVVADFAADFALNGRQMVMDAEQRLILDAIFAVDGSGRPACFEIGVVAPRQNLKTAVLQMAALADLFLFRVQLHIWTAHLFKTTQAAFQGLIAMIDSAPEWRRLCKPPRTGNGDEAIELRSGGAIRFYARSKGGGRGLTGDRVTLDEGLFLSPPEMGALLPTMATIQDAQVRYGSSAGLGSSDVLRGVRDRGRAGGAARLGYFEWTAEQRECADRCEHLPDTPGCVLDDRELWAQANPALGRRISMDVLQSFRSAMPPAEFAREFLGWWDEPDEAQHPIDVDAWERCGIDPGSDDAKQILRPLAFAVDCSEGLVMTTVGVAGQRSDGKAQVELAARERGTGWVVEWVRGRVSNLRPCAVVVDPSGPAGFLVEKFRQAGVEVIEPTGRDVAQACLDLQATVNEGLVRDEDGNERPSELVHVRDPLLTAAVSTAEQRPSGAFTRDNARADASGLYAATLALHGLVRFGLSGTSVYEDRGLIVL